MFSTTPFDPTKPPNMTTGVLMVPEETMKAKDAEIERLRAALTRIMELGYHSLDPDVDKRMTEIAREALSQK